ncbi:MAG: hypothetical protein KDD82_06775, partial [Planctomycetes bacterium]|nr:hypothetical protein [Planctomycetota bacterium]
LLVCLALMARAPRDLRRAAVWAALPYALYALFVQNLAHPRHLLPLVLVGGLLAGQGLGRLRVRPRLRWLAAAAAVCTLASGGVRHFARRAAHGRTADQVLALLEGCDPLATRLYAGLLARPLRERRPELDVRPARDLEHVARLLAADPAPPAWILISPEVVGAERLEPVCGPEPLLYRWDRGRAGL